MPKVLTFDENNQECWTNPPSRNISQVWEFIEHIFKHKYIKSFLFYNELKFNNKGEMVNTSFHLNPKKPKEDYVQLELF